LYTDALRGGAIISISIARGDHAKVLIAKGYDNRTVAKRVGISPGTVKAIRAGTWEPSTVAVLAAGPRTQNEVIRDAREQRDASRQAGTFNAEPEPDEPITPQLKPADEALRKEVKRKSIKKTRDTKTKK